MQIINNGNIALTQNIRIMKKFLFVVTMLWLVGIGVNAQKIKKIEVDKFTGAEIIETSAETLYSKTYMLNGYSHRFKFIIRRAEGNYAIAASIIMPDIVKYTENDGVTFLLNNGETISLKTRYTGLGVEQYGAGYNFDTVFMVPLECVEKLKQHKITDVRVTYMGGKYDKEIEKKKQDLIQKMLNLFE